MSFKNLTPLWVLLFLSLTACSGGKSGMLYEDAKMLDELELPPDLSTPANTGTEEIPSVGNILSHKNRKLLKAKGIRIAHDGLTRWLIIDAGSEKLWPRLRKFWPSVGLQVEWAEPAIGIMETAWAENQANVYSLEVRDKYRLRLEPLSSKRTAVYVSHYGLKKVASNDIQGIYSTEWETRPSDSELVNEILNRLVLHLGGDKAIAKKVKAPVTGSGKSELSMTLKGSNLQLKAGFSRSWRLVGLALDRIGLVINDRNRSEGIYYVTGVEALKEDKKNWLGTLFTTTKKKDGPQWRIQLLGKNTVQVRVRDAKGKAAPKELSELVLKRIQEALQ